MVRMQGNNNYDNFDSYIHVQYCVTMHATLYITMYMYIILIYTGATRDYCSFHGQ